MPTLSSSTAFELVTVQTLEAERLVFGSRVPSAAQPGLAVCFRFVLFRLFCVFVFAIKTTVYRNSFGICRGYLRSGISEGRKGVGWWWGPVRGTVSRERILSRLSTSQGKFELLPRDSVASGPGTLLFRICPVSFTIELFQGCWDLSKGSATQIMKEIQIKTMD